MLRRAKSEPGKDAGSVRIGKYGRDLPGPPESAKHFLGWDRGRRLATLCSRSEREMTFGTEH